MLAASGSVGPLNSVAGYVGAGQDGTVPAGRLGVHGFAKLDSASSLNLYINHSGTTAGTDYSQLNVTGNVTLAGDLSISGQQGTSCPGLHVGDVDTLITTPGTITGTFTGIPSETTIPLSCSGATTPTVTISYTAHTMTATVKTAPAEAPSCNRVVAGTIKNTAVTVQLSCIENSTAPLTYAIVQAPSHGTLGAIDQSRGKVTYTPAAGYTGGDMFAYEATSIHGTSNTAEVQIRVAATRFRTRRLTQAMPHAAQIAGHLLMLR